MIETFCKEHKLTTFECVACQREDFELEHEEEIAALREENERLRQDANPWRYPSRGELPERDRAYEVTLGNDTVERLRWTGSDWIDRNGWVTGYVRAFRELPEPAPELEVEK